MAAWTVVCSVGTKVALTADQTAEWTAAWTAVYSVEKKVALMAEWTAQ